TTPVKRVPVAGKENEISDVLSASIAPLTVARLTLDRPTRLSPATAKLPSRSCQLMLNCCVGGLALNASLNGNDCVVGTLTIDVTKLSMLAFFDIRTPVL